MKKAFLLAVATLMAAALVFTGCPSDDGNKQPESKTVAFESVTAVNGADEGETTSALQLKFSAAITGLSAADITLTDNDNKAAAVTKGAISDKGNGLYELAISGVAKGETLTVKAAKNGYTINPDHHTVQIIYQGGTAVAFIGVTAIDDADNTTTALKLTFAGDIEGLAAADITLQAEGFNVTRGGLSRTGEGVYELDISGFTQGGAVSVTVVKNGYTFTDENHSPRATLTVAVKYLGRTTVAFTALTAYSPGYINKVTRALELQFDADIDGLSADDITLQDMDVEKDGLAGEGNGLYRLAIRGFTADGELTVIVAEKAGYTIVPDTLKVNIVYEQPASSLPALSLSDGSGPSGEIGVGDIISLSADLADILEEIGLPGDIDIEDVLGALGDDVVYQWTVGANTAEGGRAYTVQAADVGKSIGLKVEVDNEELGIFSLETADTVGPVQNGWMVETITRYVDQTTDNTGNADRSIPNARGIAIDSTGMLYITGNARWSGRRLFTVDPNETPAGFHAGTGLIPARHLTDTLGNNVRGTIAVGPDDSVYYSTDYSNTQNNGASGNGEMSVISFANTGAPTAAKIWDSGNVFDYMRDNDGQGSYYYPTTENNNMNRNELGDLAVDANGNVYLTTTQWNLPDTDTRASTIVKIQPDGTAERFAGGIQGYAEGQRLDAQFSYDFGGITIGHDNNLYVADGRNAGRIRKIDVTSGQVTTWVGGTYGDDDGGFRLTGGLTYGRDGNYYLVDRTNDGDRWPAIWRITEEGKITLIAGSTGRGRISNNNQHEDNQDNRDAAGANMRDGHAKLMSEAGFHRPYGIAADADGTVYVLDNAFTNDNFPNPPGAGTVRKIWWDGSIN